MRVAAASGGLSLDGEAPGAANRLYFTQLSRHLGTGKSVVQHAIFGEVSVLQKRRR
jgi:hypothetical protein